MASICKKFVNVVSAIAGLKAVLTEVREDISEFKNKLFKLVNSSNGKYKADILLKVNGIIVKIS